MKNLFKLLFVVVLLTACTETEPVIFDSVNGQVGVGFDKNSPSTRSVIVPEEGVTEMITIFTNILSSSDRTFDLIIDDTSVVSSNADYSIGTLTIPANSYQGTVEIIFDNFSDLVENTKYSLILNLDLPTGVNEFDSQTFTLNYLKKIICNDLDLTISTDYWSDETTWEIKDNDGVVVQSGGPYPRINGGATYNYNFYLDDGAYTFYMYDAYGDGMVTAAQTGIDAVVGSYSLDCGLINHVSGGGAFGSEEVTEFNVNL